MEPLTKDDYTVKDTFAFAEEVRTQNSEHYMSSFDVDSLFTNIPLNETIDICCDELFRSRDKVSDMSKEEFRILLELATKESFILFNNQYYKQIEIKGKNRK